MSTNSFEWIVIDNENTHIIKLKIKNKKYILCVDGEKREIFQQNKFFNDEYRFNVGQKQCSIVKFVTDKIPGFVVDGVYQNKDRKYYPITKPPFISKIILVLNAIIFLGIVLYSFINFKYEEEYMLFFFIVACFSIFVNVFSRYISTAPVVIKSEKNSLLYRVSILIILNLAYYVVLIYFFEKLIF